MEYYFIRKYPLAPLVINDRSNSAVASACRRRRGTLKFDFRRAEGSAAEETREILCADKDAHKNIGFCWRKSRLMAETPVRQLFSHIVLIIYFPTMIKWLETDIPH